MTDGQGRQRGRWLIAALQRGDLRRAEQLIREGADMAVRAAEGETALYTALAYEHFRVVEPLLQAAADPNVPGDGGTYPIHLAVEWGGEHAPGLVATLLQHGARLDVRDGEGATPTFMAGKVASWETVRVLLEHGGDINDRNRELDTALTFACCWGMAERAALLLDAGIDLEAQDNLGMNALMWAAGRGHADTVALLLRRGARVDVADEWGRTPLAHAVAAGSECCVRLLTDAAAPCSRGDEASPAESAQ